MRVRAKRRRAVAWLASLFVLGILAVPQAGQAQESEPTDMFEVSDYEFDFSADEATVIELPEPLNELQTDAPSPLRLPYVDVPGLRGPGVDCGVSYAKVIGKTAAGDEMFAYSLKIEYCYQSGIIRYLRVNRWGTADSPVWYFCCHIGTWTEGGIGETSFTYRTQGRFCMGVDHPTVPCLAEERPWLELTVRANGTWSGTGGGNE